MDNEFRVLIGTQLRSGDIDKLKKTIQQSLNSHKFTISLGNKINTSNIKIQANQAGAKAGNAFSQSFKNKARIAVSTNELQSSVAKVKAQYQSLSDTGHASLTVIKNDLATLSMLQTRLQNFKGVGNGNALAYGYEKFNTVLKKVQNNLNVVSASTKNSVSSLQIAGLDNRISTWMNNNTRASKQYGEAIRNLRNRLSELNSSGNATKGQLKQIENAFNNIKIQANQAGLAGKSFISSFKGAFKSISRYVGVSTLIFSSINAIKNGVNSIIELDTALVDLRKTTDGTEAQLKEFYYTANDVAKKLGTTTQEVIQSAADWSRLGYSLKDSKTMSEVSSIFKSISPGMDIEKATDGLVSAMKAFDIEAENALDGIASKINAVGNTQAVDNNDLVEIITRASSAMSEANNTFEETIALGTAATEITRDAESVGNALKTISMRIRGYDEETSEYIGNTEVLAGAIADYTKTAKAPNGISLFTDGSKTEFKSTTQLLREISEIYDDLTDKQQAGLLEKLAGKHLPEYTAMCI